MPLSKNMRDALKSNNVDTLSAELSTPPLLDQIGLNLCLDKIALEGSLEMIEYILKRGSKLTVVSHCRALRRQDPNLLQLLLDYGWDVNSTEFGWSSVEAALTWETSLRWLLDHGADPNLMGERIKGSCAERRTPLIAAAKLSDTTPLKIILAHGARMDPRAMFSAMSLQGDGTGIPAMAVLLDHGADINGLVRNFTPLMYAVYRRSKREMLFLLDRGADPAFRVSESRPSAAENALASGEMELYHILQTPRPKDAP